MKMTAQTVVERNNANAVTIRRREGSIPGSPQSGIVPLGNGFIVFAPVEQVIAATGRTPEPGRTSGSGTTFFRTNPDTIDEIIKIIRSHFKNIDDFPTPGTRVGGDIAPAFKKEGFPDIEAQAGQDFRTEAQLERSRAATARNRASTSNITGVFNTERQTFTPSPGLPGNEGLPQATNAAETLAVLKAQNNQPLSQAEMRALQTAQQREQGSPGGQGNQGQALLALALLGALLAAGSKK